MESEKRGKEWVSPSQPIMKEIEIKKKKKDEVSG
jgi:hypothetical protein